MSKLNKSGLHPLGCAVLVQPYEPTRKDSVIVLPKSAEDRSNMIENRAIVIEIGPHAWHDEPPRAKIGDHVLISSFAGKLCTGIKDNKAYRVINDRDIFCGLEVSDNE